MIDQAPNLAQLANETAEKFATKYGRQPRWIVAAPGRVNIIGEHTDYNDGFVFPMAIERYTVIAADRPAVAKGPAQFKWTCTRLGETAIINTAEPIQKGKPAWSNYIRGVIAGFQKLGVELGSLDVLMQSTVPLGGGLSSSAALEVATATLLEVVTGTKMSAVDKALLCQKAEHEFAGVPCGIMDQFTSALGKEGHLLLLDCRTRTTELVPMADPDIAVLITNTNVRHELGNGEYAKRRAQCETAAKILGVASLRDASMASLEAKKSVMDPVVYKRARHVIGEIDRTTKAAKAIRAGRLDELGQLMYASHDSLRDDYAVSCKELDEVVEIARHIGTKGGMIGCRMTGGGFGGCTVSLVKTSEVKNIADTIFNEYQNATGIKPALFVSRPAAGATILKA
jgi:galactokinase